MAGAKSRHWVCTLVSLLAISYAIPSVAASSSTLDVTVNWNPDKSEPGNAVWLGYLMARANFIDSHGNLYQQAVGPITPTFEEEVDARTAAAAIYRELREKDRSLNLPYFNDLNLVVSHSFMGEYVWTYLRQPTWAAPPSDLKLQEFNQWRQSNLPGHQAITKGGINFAAKSRPEAAKSESPSKDYSLLLQGRQVLQQGDPQRAITDFFQPVIDHCTLANKGNNKRLYSAQNQLQMVIYAALPTPAGQSAEVLTTEWADAYLLKAYALTELKRIPEAQTALESAIGLSPMNSQFQSELAYTYQVQKDCAKSIAAYAEAATVAELGSEDATKTADLTRAWRGQGYCLVEQGKLDAAEAMYRKALVLDPNDNKSKGELQYIKGLRNH